MLLQTDYILEVFHNRGMKCLFYLRLFQCGDDLALKFISLNLGIGLLHYVFSFVTWSIHLPSNNFNLSSTYRWFSCSHFMFAQPSNTCKFPLVSPYKINAPLPYSFFLVPGFSGTLPGSFGRIMGRKLDPDGQQQSVCHCHFPWPSETPSGLQNSPPCFLLSLLSASL